MNDQMKKKIGVIAVAFVAIAGVALAAQNSVGGGAQIPSRSTLIEQCINDPYDYVKKQNREYCECFADHYPAVLKRIQAIQGKSPEEVTKILGSEDPMKKCESMKARDLQKETQVLRQQLVDSCIKYDHQPAAYCECTAEYMAQRQLAAMKAGSEDNKTFADAMSASEQCNHLQQTGKPVTENNAPSGTVAFPDHLDVKDEHGNTVRLPVKMPPQSQKQ